VTAPTATLCARGVSWRVASCAGMVGRMAQSEGVAGVVVTSVLRLGVSASPVAVTRPLEPGHAVSRLLP
jgi:hypothetical protein